MYYIYKKYLPVITHRTITTLFAFFISLFVFNPIVLASKDISQSAEEYRMKGYEEQQKGHFDKALTFYIKAVELGEGNAAIYNDIGVVYEQLNLQARAEEFYLRAIQIGPEYLPPYTNLAYLYLDVGRTEEAVDLFIKRYNMAPEYDPWRDRVRDELIKISPEFKDKLIHSQAEQLNRELVEKAHEEFYVNILRAEKHFGQGLQLIKEGKYSQALTELELALSITPDNPKILKARDETIYRQKVEKIRKRTNEAMQLLDLGETKAARKEFKNILAIIPE